MYHVSIYKIEVAAKINPTSPAEVVHWPLHQPFVSSANNNRILIGLA
jgi:hypothetical protein